ncbi:hypothetical protein K5D43_04325 [Pseudomonas cichorii]|nr:hypothetical protein [Pseudomonas cichorii]MBX8553694.1 hypothetical protein [Pseudomonas cichorii]
MHPAISALVVELEASIAYLQSGPFPQEAVLGVAHANSLFPAITGSDVVAMLADVRVRLIEDVAEDLGAYTTYFELYLSRLQFMRVNTLPQIWGNAQVAISAVFITLDVLKRALSFVSIVQKDEASKRRVAANQLRSVERQLKQITNRSENVESMMARIESAHEAAELLPEDIESLSEAREQVRGLLAESEKDRIHILATREAIDALQELLRGIENESKQVLQKAEHAYSANTSQGLAAAFADRSSRLGWSMWAWVVGLVAALSLGSIFGKSQLQALAELMKAPSASESAIILNLMLSVISIGAPIWFAWLSTKQIGQRFRLSEDYAFKASVSKAYEGYRREAHRVDTALEAQLLRSALARLDEQPLRFVESTSFGSPGHEIMSSDLLKEAVKIIPNFAAQLNAFLNNLISREKSRLESRPANSPSLVTPPGEEKA